MHLYEQHCLTETSPQLLTEAQRLKYIKEIPGWNFVAEKKSISRTFKFKDYQQTLQFINTISSIINEENHHPVITFGYNYCTLYFSTHSADGITLFDFICAARIDQLISNQELNI